MERRIDIFGVKGMQHPRLYAVQVLCLVILNLPFAGLLGSQSSIFLNLVVLGTTLTLGWLLVENIDRRGIAPSFFGLPRSRRLLFSAFGGLFITGVVTIFGATVMTVNNPHVPLAFRMPDTSLLNEGLLTTLLCFLGTSTERTWLRKLSLSMVPILIALAAVEIKDYSSGGVDYFRYASTLWALIGWGLLCAKNFAQSDI